MCNKEQGFTLIELLIVVAIIGILAAIAIPEFARYKTRGFNARVLNDIRNAITAEEANFATEEQYVQCQNAACNNSLPNFSLSEGTTLNVTIVGGGEFFAATASHPNGTLTADYSSQTGELVETFN